MRSVLRNWIIPAVFSSALLWMPLGAVTAAQISSKDLAHAIADRASRVDEFRFIREKAEKLGVRAWLFGGTAAGFGHYVNWDLKRGSGDKRFQPDRFDYDYTNIYRSTQDLDIVIDGTPEKATQLEQALRLKYPHLQGSKSAWEVRLLKSSVGEKEAILDNPDYLNQHTDSNSTGMIEITKPAPGEQVVRDLRDWNSKDPNFLKDLREGKLHYYFSPKHEETARAARGLNPPILSAIRYLTKAFQYELELRPEDLAQIKKVIAGFDPARDARDPYVAHWIEKNGKKLIQNAVNIEYAWNQLESLGLRKKLISLRNDPDSVESLAWWLSREPLRGSPLGKGRGKTAKQLGLDVVAHETQSFLAYESITLSHSGEPNALISRSNKRGESAAYGDGFYTKVGTEGARGTGLTIRFHLDPRARVGSDFEIPEERNIVLVKNKSALRVIPESLNLTPLEYLKRLAQDQKISEADRGILEKFRRRVQAKTGAMTAAEEKELASFVRKTTNLSVIQEWMSWPVSERHPGIIRAAIRAAIDSNELVAYNLLFWEIFPRFRDPSLFAEAAKNFRLLGGFTPPNETYLTKIFSSPLWKDDVSLFLKEIDRGDWVFLQQAIMGPLSSGWGDHPELPQRILDRATQVGLQNRKVMVEDVAKLLKLPHWRNHVQLLEPIFKSGLADHVLIENLLALPIDRRPPQMLQWIDQIIERGRDFRVDLALLENLEPDFWKKNPEKFRVILERGNADAIIAKKLLSRPEWKDPELLKLLIDRGKAGPEIIKYVLAQPFWEDHLDEIQRLTEVEKKSGNTFMLVNALASPEAAAQPKLFINYYKLMNEASFRDQAIQTLRNPAWVERPEVIDFLLGQKDTEKSIIRLLELPYYAGRGDLVDRLIRNPKLTDPYSGIAQELLMNVVEAEHWRSHPRWSQWTDQIIHSGALTSENVLGVLKLPEALRHPEWVAHWIEMAQKEKGDQDALSAFNQLLSETDWKKSNELKKWVGSKKLTGASMKRCAESFRKL